ncbi:MAG: hypothetical protein KatS3mg094_136 [Candidatus Parcubacteria bacterium]|nr:MAG: hypothetical protein KatS3mg094_136 [Candidatus Parcubacteria bacterium]
MKKFLILFIFLLPILKAFAASIDSNYKFAWGENIGWVNFNPNNGNVQVFDDKLTGYAWSANYGWINLSPTNRGVYNDGNGNLSGYAWGEHLGWIDFSSVKINPSTGEFSGYAIILIDGSKINFDCANCKVKTDWRKNIQSQPSQPSFSSGGRSFYVSQKNKKEEISQLDTIRLILQLLGNLIQKPKETVLKIINKETKLISEVPYYFKKNEFNYSWPILLTYSHQNRPLSEFTKNYFPEEIKNLVQKIPKLGEIFDKIGINNLVNLLKLKVVNVFVPSLSEIIGFRLPTTSISSSVRDKIPEDIIFIKSVKGNLDLKPRITLDEKGSVIQKINLISEQGIILMIKPSDKVKNIKGYLIYRGISNSFLGKILSFVLANEVEERLKINEFEYQDKDEDGFYIAEISLPKIVGDFEIKTIIEYEKIDLGKKELKLITAINPEGYVYEKIFGKEARIEGAKVYLYWFNSETKKFELWPANKYAQINPQITDKFGNYVFFVPEGRYYLKIEKENYYPFKSDEFFALEGGSVNQNIKLKPKYWFLFAIDWKFILIIILLLILIFKSRIKSINKE